MMNRNTLTLSLAALTTLAGSVIALPEPEEAKVILERTAGSGGTWFTTASGPPHAESGVIEIIQSDDDEKVEVRIEQGDVVFVKHNGEVLEPSRYEFKDGNVFILDGSDPDEVMRKIRVVSPEAPAGALSFSTAGAVSAPGAVQFFSVDPDSDDVAFFSQPKVMMGINRSTPGEALRYHLGLSDEHPGILIDWVIEGLPADKAGLERFDIIVKVDGETVSGDGLGEYLQDREPGDEMEVVVIRKGDKKKLRLKLEEYDGTRLHHVTPDVVGFSAPRAPVGRFIHRTPDGDFVFGPGDGNDFRVFPDADDFEFDLEFAPEAFSDPEKVREWAEQIRERASLWTGAEVEGNRVRIRPPEPLMLQERFNELTGEADELRARIVDRVDSQMGPRLEELEERLKALEETLDDRLEQLLDRLESLNEKLEEDEI